MAVFDRIKPGDVLYDVHRQRMGNTMMSRMACFDYEHSLKKLRRSKPKGGRG